MSMPIPDPSAVSADGRRGYSVHGSEDNSVLLRLRHSTFCCKVRCFANPKIPMPKITDNYSKETPQILLTLPHLNDIIILGDKK